MAKTSRISAPHLWMVLSKSHRVLTQLVEQGIAAAGLCMSDFMVIEALLHKGPLTISEIQAKVLLATGSMTVAVDRVESKGLVVRTAVSNDRRARRLELTPAGRHLAQSVFDKHAEDLEAIMSALDDREKEQLYGPLRKLGLSAAEVLERRKEKKDDSDSQK